MHTKYLVHTRATSPFLVQPGFCSRLTRGSYLLHHQIIFQSHTGGVVYTQLDENAQQCLREIFCHYTPETPPILWSNVPPTKCMSKRNHRRWSTLGGGGGHPLLTLADKQRRSGRLSEEQQSTQCCLEGKHLLLLQHISPLIKALFRVQWFAHVGQVYLVQSHWTPKTLIGKEKWKHANSLESRPFTKQHISNFHTRELCLVYAYKLMSVQALSSKEAVVVFSEWCSHVVQAVVERAVAECSHVSM